MEASSWVTYADKVTYTLYFTTYQYIPKDGILTVKLPKDATKGEIVTITSSPVPITSSATGLSYSSHTTTELKLKAS